jgi:alkylated DNA repair dioxygenase AlkB
VKNHIIHKDFYLIENVLSQKDASLMVQDTLLKGADPIRGFQNPKLKPNRFGKDLFYPVKKYMCYGLYWDPLTYLYTDKIPGNSQSPYSIPETLVNIANDALKIFFPHYSQNSTFHTCLVNFYSKNAEGKDSKMSLHQDKDETDKSFPVIGLSLGSTAKFYFEDSGKQMREVLIPDRSLYLFGDSMRLMRHGIKNVLARTLPNYYEELINKERLSFTLRKVL